MWQRAWGQWLSTVAFSDSLLFIEESKHEKEQSRLAFYLHLYFPVSRTHKPTKITNTQNHTHTQYCHSHSATNTVTPTYTSQSHTHITIQLHSHPHCITPTHCITTIQHLTTNSMRKKTKPQLKWKTKLAQDFFFWRVFLFIIGTDKKTQHAPLCLSYLPFTGKGSEFKSGIIDWRLPPPPFPILPVNSTPQFLQPKREMLDLTSELGRNINGNNNDISRN